MVSLHVMGGHRIVPFSANRQMVAASCAVSRDHDTIHCLTEVDVSEPRRLLRAHRDQTGESLSFTAYVVHCLAKTVAQMPEVNAFRSGRRLVLLDDVTISVLVERELPGEKVPEPLPIHSAQSKGYRAIHEEIRTAQRTKPDGLGGLSGMERLLRWIPGWLLRTFIRLAERNIAMGKRYGKIAVTAVGMHGENALWFTPITSATVTVTVGSLVQRPVEQDGHVVPHEHLCLTVSFDHAIVDGAPAARFVKRFGERLRSGDAIRAALAAWTPPTAAPGPTPAVPSP